MASVRLWRALRLTDAGVGTHNQHGEVGAVAGEAEDGGLQVLVVSCQIDEGDHLGGALADLLRRPRLAVVDDLHGDQRTSASLPPQDPLTFPLKTIVLCSYLFTFLIK